MRWKRWIVTTLVVLLLLGGGLFIAARLYLRSSAVAARVARQFEETLGVPVHVGQADIGLFGGSTVRDVQVFEPNKDAWLTVDEISADVSALDVLRGKVQPRHVTLRGVKATLRFDREGDLLTELPTPKSDKTPEKTPAVTVERCTLTVHQEGRPAFVLGGIRAELQESGDKQEVSGTIDDPEWGPWTVQASTGPEKGRAALTLRTARGRVTQKRLESVPFVSEKIWKQVQAEGTTAAEVTVHIGGKDDSYHVVLEPKDATFDVTAVHTHITQTTGKILIDDGIVKLQNMRGTAAGGQVQLGADLDFREEVDKLHFNVGVTGADMHTLTASWDLPPQIKDIKGHLSGRADLVVTVGDKVDVNGQGEGKIADARILDLPTDGPVTLKLRYENGKPKFSTEMSTSTPARSASKGCCALPQPAAPARDAALARSPQRQQGRHSPALAGAAGCGMARPCWRCGLRAGVTAAPPPGQTETPAVSLLSYPGKAASLLQKGVSTAASAIADAGRGVVRYFGTPKGTAQAAKPAKPPTYFEVNFGFKDIDLGQLVKRLKVGLPFPVTGRGSLHVHAALPVDQPKEVALYKVTGTIDLSRIKVADLELTRVTARINLDKGVLRLAELKGEVPDRTPGRFDGTAQMQVAPLGDASAHLALVDIPVSKILSLVPAAAGKIAGAFNGDVDWRAPAKGLQDPATWNARVNARADRLEAFGWAVDQVSLSATVKDGVLDVSSIKGGLKGLDVSGSARATLRDRYPFEARVGLDRADLAALRRLAPGVQLPVNIKGRLTVGATATGTLTPLSVDAKGNVEAASLEIDAITIESFQAAWKADTSHFRLDNIRARLDKGTVTGSVSAPLKDTAAGGLDLRLSDVDLGVLTKNIKSFPVRVEGQASGRIEGTVTPAGPGKPRALSSKIDIKAPRLRVQNIPAERLHGTVTYVNSVLEYKLQGESLGGTFDVNGRLPPGRTQSSALPPQGGVDTVAVQAPPPEAGGSFHLRGARLGRLWEALGIHNFLASLGGRVDLDLTYQQGARPEDTTGTGRVTLTDLRWGDTALTSRLASPLRLKGSQLSLPEVSAILGEGVLRARAGINLRELDRSWFTVNLDRVEAARLLVVFPGVGNAVQGPLDVSIRGHLGQRWQGHGEAVLARGKVGGVDVDEWRVPFRFEFGPGDSGGRLDVQDSTAQVGLGRATAQLHAGFGAASRVTGSVRFAQVDLRNVLRSSESSLSVAGRVSGRFDFGGQDVRSLNDLTGQLSATLRQSQALQLPGLRQIAPYLRITPTTRIDRGDLQATLTRGAFRVRRLSLSGDYLRLFARGTVTLQGRLSLSVIARTGIVAVGSPVLRALGIAAVGPTPAALLVRAAAWLSSVSIRLRVTGTLQSPSVQFESLPQFVSEEVLRFFLFNSAGGAGAAAAEFVPLP